MDEKSSRPCMTWLDECMCARIMPAPLFYLGMMMLAIFTLKVCQQPCYLQLPNMGFDNLTLHSVPLSEVHWNWNTLHHQRCTLYNLQRCFVFLQPMQHIGYKNIRSAKKIFHNWIDFLRVSHNDWTGAQSCKHFTIVIYDY